MARPDPDPDSGLTLFEWQIVAATILVLGGLLAAGLPGISRIAANGNSMDRTCVCCGEGDAGYGSNPYCPNCRVDLIREREVPPKHLRALFAETP